MNKIHSAKDLLDLAKNKGYEVNPPIDIETIAREILNLRIEFVPNLKNNDQIGSITFDSNGACIEVNTLQNVYTPRKRFTIAHEIGHFCLHGNKNGGFIDDKKSMSRTGSYWDKLEYEANKFAAELLMPEDMLIDKAIELFDKKEIISETIFIAKMSNIFCVSNAAMEYRLTNIGILKTNKINSIAN